MTTSRIEMTTRQSALLRQMRICTIPSLDAGPSRHGRYDRMAPARRAPKRYDRQLRSLWSNHPVHGHRCPSRRSIAPYSPASRVRSRRPQRRPPLTPTACGTRVNTRRWTHGCLRRGSGSRMVALPPPRAAPHYSHSALDLARGIALLGAIARSQATKCPTPHMQ